MSNQDPFVLGVMEAARCFKYIDILELNESEIEGFRHIRLTVGKHQPKDRREEGIECICASLMRRYYDSFRSSEDPS